MISFFLGLWNRIQIYVIIAIGFVAAFAAAYGFGRRGGVAAERHRVLENEVEVQLSAGEVRAEVAGLSDAAVAERLRQYTQR